MGESLKNRYATRIEAASLVDQLVDRIRDNIVSGSFTPGARIKVKEIAEDHGVSMIPVREALARLLASRLVRAEANRGYFVASRPAPEEYAERVKARELLETSALAAGFNNIDKIDIQSLRTLNEKMRKLAAGSPDKRGILARWTRLNAEFHKILVGSLRNRYFDSIFSDLALESSMARPFADNPPPYAALIEQHQAIIDAIEASNLSSAVEELTHHINSLTNVSNECL